MSCFGSILKDKRSSETIYKCENSLKTRPRINSIRVYVFLLLSGNDPIAAEGVTSKNAGPLEVMSYDN